MERPPDGALDGRDGLRACAGSRRRLRGRRRRIHAATRRSRGHAEQRGSGARNQLRRPARQRLRAPRARQRGCRRDGAWRPRRHRSHRPQHHRARSPGLREAPVGRGDARLGDPRFADCTAGRHDRRFPDGARGLGRFRAHRAGGRHRYHRGRFGLRAPGRRTRARVATVRSISEHCASSAWRPWWPHAISRCSVFSTTSDSLRRSGCRSCGGSDRPWPGTTDP